MLPDSDRLAEQLPEEPELLLAACVPEHVKRLQTARDQAGFPCLRPFEGAVATIDIAGFTALSERLGAAGRGAGAERIQQLLNRCFGRLTALVADHGGETVDFAGDSLIALWPAGGDATLEQATKRAIDFALRAQRHARSFGAVDDVPIALRAGIGSGAAFTAVVGGLEHRWYSVVGGAAVERSAIACTAALPTQVVVSPETLTLVDRSLLGTETGDGLVVERLLDPPERAPRAAASRLDPAACTPFVPRAVREQIAAGVGRWLAELRHLTVLFLELGDLARLDPTAPTSLDRFDRAIRTIQKEVYRFGGTVNQLIVDDKGTVVLAGWGLATHAHEDDASRATRCALAIAGQLGRLGSSCRLGLATGRTFSGWRGGLSRAQFAMIGATVNRAARLMQAADSILCDAPTREAASGVAFSQARSVSLKGLAEPLTVYEPQTGAADQARRRTPVIGRERELERLSGLLRGLTDHGRSATCIVSADAGLGKSTLMSAWLERTRRAPVRTLFAKAEALERATPYFAWRQLLAPMLGSDAESVRKDLERALSGFGAPSEQAPLFEPILGLGMSDNEATRSLAGRARADRLRELIARWFRHLAGERPLVAVIEDAHWLDASSWALLETIHAERSLLLVLATRPLDDDAGAEARRLLAHCDERIDLEQLSPSEIETLAASRIGVSKVPAEVARFVTGRASGHPFYAEELMRALLEHGLIEVSHGECVLLAPAEQLEQLEISGGIQGTVASRIDRLDVSRQLTLKVASVLGEEIDLETLEAVHPAANRRDGLVRDLDQMVERDLLIRGGPRAPEYRFRHDITRQVAYELLPFAQRRQLNRAVAEALEARHAADLAPHYSVLAHHWREADQASETLHYLDRAAMRARSLDAHAEVVRFLGEALTLTGKVPPSDGGGENRWRPSLTAAAVREARWRSLLGQSLSTLGRYRESEAELRRALALYREPLPSGALARRAKIVQQISKQLLRRIRAAPAQRLAVQQSGPLLDVVRTLVALNTIAYHSNDRERMLFALFTSLNLAERCEPTTELVSVYSRACMAAGILGLHRLASAYVRTTQAASQAVGDAAATAEATNLVSIYRLAIGEWQALGVIEESMERADRIGDHAHWTQAAYVCALAYSTLGRFRDSERLAAAIEDRSASRRALLPRIWALRARAEALLGLGRLEPARVCCEQAAELLKQTGDAASTTAIQVYNLLTVTMHRLGRRRRAWELAELTLDLLGRADFVGYDFFSWHHGIAETLLDLWREGYRYPDGRDARDLGLAVCRSFARVDRHLPPGYARSQLARGIAAHLGGARRRAHRHWRRALRTAEEFGLRYEEAYARYQIARFTVPERRDRHLARARDLFSDLGDEYHVAQIARARELDEAPGA